MTPILTSRGRRVARLLALALVAMLALAACGAGTTADDGVVSLASPTPAGNGAPTPAASVDPEAAMEAFTACMKEHGVDVQVSIATGTDDGKGGAVFGGPIEGTNPGSEDAQPNDVALDPEAMQEADAACRDLLPSGTFGDPTATMDPALADQLLDFAKCMREQGIDYPDPKFSGGGVTMELGGPDGEGRVDPTSDEFQAAQEACGQRLPGGGPFVVGGSAAEPAP